MWVVGGFVGDGGGGDACVCRGGGVTEEKRVHGVAEQQVDGILFVCIQEVVQVVARDRVDAADWRWSKV